MTFWDGLIIWLTINVGAAILLYFTVIKNKTMKTIGIILFALLAFAVGMWLGGL
jgi:hypothetical protein